jgi:hypothetical protein
MLVWLAAIAKNFVVIGALQRFLCFMFCCNIMVIATHSSVALESIASFYVVALAYIAT